MSFHGLRRACATWLLVAWLDEVLVGIVPAGIAAESVRPGGARDLLGDDPARVLWSLARFLGHGSPSVTLAHYMLCLDWIAYRMTESAAAVTLPSGAAARLVGVSTRRARALARASHGQVPILMVIEAQRRRLAAHGRGRLPTSTPSAGVSG
jgi:hypothetical protein